MSQCSLEHKLLPPGEWTKPEEVRCYTIPLFRSTHFEDPATGLLTHIHYSGLPVSFQNCQRNREGTVRTVGLGRDGDQETADWIKDTLRVALGVDENRGKIAWCRKEEVQFDCAFAGNIDLVVSMQRQENCRHLCSRSVAFPKPPQAATLCILQL